MNKTLYIVFGLPGSGKTTVAKYLLDMLPKEEILHISADGIRKELFPVPEYSKKASKKVWETCVNRAQEAMGVGKTIVWDAVFAHEYRRQEVKKLAEEGGYETVFVLVTCDRDESIKSRLEARRDDLSDADYSIYCTLKEVFQTPEDPLVIQIDNSLDLESLISRINSTFPTLGNS
ncbi:MAG: AAA family ATPase [Candidatus Gracilibacteria bacterium]